eukprot:gnl/MRDRNA2_/MRDRNA2_103643_c0_seq1.p1 gnl/MRDRNA2_/MRDRNA2_103643_c0~~gnl/MRDRNA2_/MRDRNA2_103643_c0_seq1.p1  ORF type:complete len:284 (-),score=43.49 gnl/MRDRNA2_/MRDRNA2_103643_c0_seq1:269-1120(-)
MKVLVIGGTGMIGTAVVKALIRHGDTVCGLARSDNAEEALIKNGASCRRGSIQVLDWESSVAECDAVVHCALVRDADMAEVDGKLMKWLLPQLGGKPFIYTGSCWVFGEGDIHEGMPFVRNAALTLDWLIDGCEAALTASHGMVIHPAALYSTDATGRLIGAGVSRYSKEAETTGSVALVKSADVHTPWIHYDDCGELYAIVLHKGAAKESYNASGFVDTSGNAALAAAKSVACVDLRLTTLSSTEAHEKMPAVGAVGWALDIPSFETASSQKLGWTPRYLHF